MIARFTTLSIPCLTLLCLLATSTQALAEQTESFNDYTIHYNTLNTNLLAPDMARVYGIQRSGNRALINIAVLHSDSDGLDTAVTARVTASASNLAGQRREIDLQEIRDQDAIYYIGTFRIHQEETLTFRVSVDPHDHAGRPHEFTFRQQFFTD
jgi:hypothetical protein